MDYPILRVGLSGLSPVDHYRLGQCSVQSVNTPGRREAEYRLRSSQIMGGELDGLAVELMLLSYEGATSVGYGVIISCGTRRGLVRSGGRGYSGADTQDG